MADSNDEIPPVPLPPADVKAGAVPPVEAPPVTPGSSAPTAPAAPSAPGAPPAPSAYGAQAGAPAAYGAPPAQPAPPAYGAPQPYGAQPAYGQPAYAQQPAGPAQGLAVTSMVLGLVGLLGSFIGLGFLPALAGVITGHFAQRRQPWARGFWITGLITGYIGLGISVITFIGFVAIWIFAFTAGSTY
jgi:hypothetical protein